MNRILTLLLFLLLMLGLTDAKANVSENSTSETTVVLKTESGELYGSLLAPTENTSKKVAALIIAGSGPTDRNGNNPSMTNNSLKFLAQALADMGIYSLRFDKRGVAHSAKAMLAEKDLRFDDYINDVKQWVDYLKQVQNMQEVIIIGHSEGALIGAVAAQQNNVDKFVSLAGAGKAIDAVLLEQLKGQPAFVLNSAKPIIDNLKKGETTDNVPAYLQSLFRKSVQPYMISWFAYDPQAEIAKVNKPTLILQGTTDIQISVDDANLLKQSKDNAKLVIIENMNHVLKHASENKQANLQTYNDPNLPIKPELVAALKAFVK